MREVELQERVWQHVRLEMIDRVVVDQKRLELGEGGAAAGWR